jgi:serine/threonine protein kinase
VKLCDFGLARMIGPDEADAPPRLTSEIEVFGTPAFMAPEQVRRSLDADPRSDVYSMGVVLFALLTGRLPFTGRSALEVMDRQLHDAPPAPSDVVPGLAAAGIDALVLRALAKAREDRFQSMRALAEAIAAVPEDAVRDARPPRARPRRTVAPWQLAVGSIALVLALWLALS